mgnify:CR=1 FL=1
MLISVVVPVYKVEKYLDRCVQSLVNQTLKDMEIILVDDGSPDNCGAICDAYAQKDSRIRVIHKENGGLSSARNAALEVAQGEYFGFVDSDDWIEPEMYETLLAGIQKYDAQMAYGGRYDIDGNTGEKTRGLCPRKEECISGMEMLGRVFLWENCDSAAWDKLYHRSLFEGIRYPQGYNSEDIAIFYKLMERVDKVAMCDKPMYNYLHRPNSITTAKLSDKTFHFLHHTDTIYPYIQKNHPELTNRARYFHIAALVYSVLMIDLASEQDQEKYAQLCTQRRKELRTHLPFLLTSSFYGKQECLTNILLALNIYIPLKKLYHKFK